MVTERVRCRQPALNPVPAAVAAQVTVDAGESAAAVAAAESSVAAAVTCAIAALVGKLSVEADEPCAVVAGVGVAAVGASAEYAPQTRAAPAVSFRYSPGR
mmetsp:Transcript_6634/g.28298  ORF Transcript_6634/g.28298 Transcript_6634/m.28298 type:complete len:101 (+) Transcript_6634:4111-4413(+)